MEKMFCYQCQETAKNEGCTIQGVCGKTADVANLQDLLMFLCKGISHYTVRLRELGIEIPQINKFITDSLFMTITNANFDKSRFISRVLMAYEIRNAAKERLLSAGGSNSGKTKRACFQIIIHSCRLQSSNDDANSSRQ